MSETPNIPLTEYPTGALTPSAPYNDAMQVIDALMRPGGRIQDKDLTTPPTTVSADVGKSWIIPSGATGAWSGKTGQIALCTAATLWRYFVPEEGWLADVLDEDTNYRYTGSVWEVESVKIQTVASSATVTPTFANDLVDITAQAAGLTLANPTGTIKNGWGIVIRIKDNGTARSITYGSEYRALGVTLPTTTVISKTLYLGMVYNSGATKWDVVSVCQEA